MLSIWSPRADASCSHQPYFQLSPAAEHQLHTTLPHVQNFDILEGLRLSHRCIFGCVDTSRQSKALAKRRGHTGVCTRKWTSQPNIDDHLFYLKRASASSGLKGLVPRLSDHSRGLPV